MKTNEIREKVLEQYRAGARATELAKEYGISRGTVYLWIENEKKNNPNFDSLFFENESPEQLQEKEDFSKERHSASQLDRIKNLLEENKKLKEEVELYKSLLAKLNTLIDSQNSTK